MPNSLKGTGLEQSNFGQGIAGTGPAFRVYAVSAVTALSTTDTRINFDTKDFDTATAFDLTNDRFQPAVAGYYQFNGCISVGSAANLITASLRKNGVIVSIGNQFVGARAGVSDLIYLNGTTDYVELFGYSSSPQNTSTGTASTYFSGFLARAA